MKLKWFGACDWDLMLGNLKIGSKYCIAHQCQQFIYRNMVYMFSFFSFFFFFNGHDNIEMPFDKEVEMENASVFS